MSKLNLENQENLPKQEFVLDPHTIIMMVGPSNSGKTHFCKNYLLGSLDSCDPDKEHLLISFSKDIDTIYISSDDCRKEILDDSYHKYDKQMLAVSGPAFDLFYKKLDLATSFPFNKEFVVLDTTGLSESFRSKIFDIAKNKHYNIAMVVFDFKDKNEYNKYVPEEDLNPKLLYKQLKQLRQEFYRTVSRKSHKILKVQSKDFDNIIITINNLDKYQKCWINDHTKYDVVGDIHGCYDELLFLLNKIGYVVQDNKIVSNQYGRSLIFVGDLIDKGPKSKEVLKFVVSNKDYVKVVLGNHDNFVYKYFNNELKDDALSPSTLINFSSIEEFKNDEGAQLLLKEVYNESYPFLRDQHLIVTHSPCDSKYLGKIDSGSTKHQRNFQYPRRKDSESNEEWYKDVKDSLSFIKENKLDGALHVCGHVGFQDIIRVGNTVLLDSGCVHGGSLSSINVEWGRYYLNSYVGADYDKRELLPNLWRSTETNKFDWSVLDAYTKRRLNGLIKNKVNFISGTMSPSDKLENNLESLEQGLNYYKGCGVDSIVLQIKHMGSRCNLYIFPELDKCYAISRNGFKIHSLNLNEIFQQFQTLSDRITKNYEFVIYDGELMPWRALGVGLIDESYKVVQEGIQSEIQFLKDYGFEEALSKLETSCAQSNWSNKLSKETTIKSVGQHLNETYSNLMQYRHIKLDQQQKMLSIFKEQLALFGGDSKLEFLPFYVLKLKGSNEEINCIAHELYSNALIYNMINTDYTSVLIDLNENNYLETAQNFFNQTIEKGYEGIVIKPFSNYIKGVAPYLKVRSPQYLSLVYGYDYRTPHKYQKLLDQKRISKKVSVSIKEYDLGRKLLDIPFNQINEDNVEYLNLCTQMIGCLKEEEKLDPRL